MLHTFLIFAVPVNVVLQLDADLPFGGLVFDVRVLQELLCVWPVGVVLHQTRIHETVKLLGPVQTIWKMCFNLKYINILHQNSLKSRIIITDPQLLKSKKIRYWKYEFLMT